MAYNKSLYIIQEKMNHFYGKTGHETEYNLLRDIYDEIEEIVLQQGGPEAREQIGQHLDFIVDFQNYEDAKNDVQHSIELVNKYGNSYEKSWLKQIL